MSTVSISIFDILGASVACEVLFIPQATPRVDGSNLVISGPKSVQTGSDGIASIFLEPGEYLVRFLGIPMNRDSLIIEVPDDDLTYSLTALISSGAIAPNFNIVGRVFTVTLAQGVDSGTVDISSLGLTSAPSRVLPFPPTKNVADDANIYASIVQSGVTATMVPFSLNAPTTTTGRILSILIVP